MKLQANFTFDRAGQGLFYHGRIYGNSQTFTVVYDCGTLSNITGATHNLSDVIQKNFRCEGPEIGLLAISHFDYDHVSHIPELLKMKNVDTVMLPHISRELRALFFAKAIFENIGEGDDNNPNDMERFEELALFFESPVDYFLEHGRARQIIGISGDENDAGNISDDGREPDMPSPEHNEGEGRPHPRLTYYRGGKPINKVSMGRYHVYSGSPRFYVKISGAAWFFKPLTVQSAPKQAFYCEMPELLKKHDGSFRKILSTKATIYELKAVYDKYIGPGKRNTHSLLLKHYPTKMRRLFPNRTYRTYPYLCCNCFCDAEYHDNSATVLLGDLNINGDAKRILRKHRFICKKVGTILIPHHGADSADLLWLDKVLKSYRCRCKTLVVSYGTENTYFNKKGHKHPRFIYDGTMVDIRNNIAFSNEKSAYSYSVK
jgi:hypothetical protein